jgi:hypothetical protein
MKRSYDLSENIELPLARGCIADANRLCKPITWQPGQLGLVEPP